jgi:hypothetical protein
MSEQEMEKGLNYGDSFSFVGRIRDILGALCGELKKELTKD